MKILFCKVFGIGNAVMAIPTIRALKSLGHEIDVFVGNTADDVGALDVFQTLNRNYPGTIKTIWSGDQVPGRYDLAIMSIPFDGRWHNGVHFNADRVIDARTRPDPRTVGLVSWMKSETEYQLDNARELGWDGECPSARIFHPDQVIPSPKSIYLGVGYKKDQKNFWSVKHWGTENYIKLARLIIDRDAESVIYLTGDALDLQVTIGPLIRAVSKPRNLVYVPTSSVSAALKVVSCCESYVGNDTGMMHVAGAAGRNVVGLFFIPNSHVKNPPPREAIYTIIHDYERRPTPEQVLSELIDL